MASCQIPKNKKKSEDNQDSSILFEDIWFVKTPDLWLDTSVDGWVNGWVSGWYHVESLKNWINCNLIEIVQFSLKMYDLWRHPHLWLGVWMGLVKSLKVKFWPNRYNWILFEDLWFLETPAPMAHVWVVWWMGHSFDIFDIFWILTQTSLRAPYRAAFSLHMAKRFLEYLSIRTGRKRDTKANILSQQLYDSSALIQLYLLHPFLIGLEQMFITFITSFSIELVEFHLRFLQVNLTEFSYWKQIVLMF